MWCSRAVADRLRLFIRPHCTSRTPKRLRQPLRWVGRAFRSDRAQGSVWRGSPKIRPTAQPSMSKSFSVSLRSAIHDRPPRYIDKLFQSVTYSWFNGASVFHWKEKGKDQQIGVPLTAIEQDDTRSFLPILEIFNRKRGRHNRGYKSTP